MRIFFGATLPDETRSQIVEVQNRLRPLIDGARYEGPDKLHITLHFIGDFDSRRVDALFGSAEAELRNHPNKSPLTEVFGLNYFPNLKVRRGIWLDCRDDGSLAAFAESVKTSSREYGVVPETREFNPHITIARLRQVLDKRGHSYHGREVSDARSHEAEDLQKLVADGKLSVERFFPRSVALFESTLKPSGSEYRILYEYPLEQSGDYDGVGSFPDRKGN